MRTAEIDSRIILAQSKYDDEILNKILGQFLAEIPRYVFLLELRGSGMSARRFAVPIFVCKQSIQSRCQCACAA